MTRRRIWSLPVPAQPSIIPSKKIIRNLQWYFCFEMIAEVIFKLTECFQQSGHWMMCHAAHGWRYFEDFCTWNESIKHFNLRHSKLNLQKNGQKCELRDYSVACSSPWEDRSFTWCKKNYLLPANPHLDILRFKMVSKIGTWVLLNYQNPQIYLQVLETTNKTHPSYQLCIDLEWFDCDLLHERCRVVWLEKRSTHNS